MKRILTFLAAPALAALALAGPCHAAVPVPAAPGVDASSFVLMDHDSGQTLAALNPDERLAPASITKLMTGHVAFQELSAEHISLDDIVTVSEKAWRMTGSRMFIEVGKQVRLEDLLRGMIIQSGNDASVAIAEHIAGSEETFVAMMNDTAARLGMHNTHFMNTTGLPHEEHYSSARDLALLSAATIREFPEYYAWYAEKEFTFNDISQRNRNALLWQDPTVDGLKTGHTEAAGYCLAASSRRDGMRLISVVMGSASVKSRTQGSRALLSYGFRFFETHRLYGAGEPITTVQVWKGDAEEVEVGLAEDLLITVPRGQYQRLDARMERMPLVIAPIDAGTDLGAVRIALDGETLAERPLLAIQSVGAGSLWRRAVDEIRLWLE